MEDAESIVGAALFGLGRGARNVWISLPATDHFRRQFSDRICVALEEPDWHAKWCQEKVYVLAHTAAMGQRAARLAAADGRTVITKQDIETAMMKVRGHLPVAGRWCPL